MSVFNPENKAEFFDPEKVTANQRAQNANQQAQIANLQAEAAHYRNLAATVA